MVEEQQHNPSDGEAELFRLLAENVKDYAVFLVDEQGRVQSWTQGAERLLGYREQEIVGQSADILFTPEDIRDGIPTLELELARKTGRGEDDRWHVRKDGNWIWSSGVTTPLWDVAGNLRGFAKIMRDRTEWKAAEEARHKSEASQAAVLETSLDGIITFDQDDRIVEFNPAAERIFGLHRNEARGRAITKLIVPAKLRHGPSPTIADFLTSTGESFLGQRIELTGMRADGSQFPAEVAVVRVPTEDAVLFTGFVRDITERKAHEGYRSVQLAVTQILAESTTIRASASRILATICENLAWDLGGFWLFDREADGLHCLDMWQRPEADLEVFEATSRDQVFASGQSLPGRVWSSGEYAWIADVTRDHNFTRRKAAAAVGLRSAFAVPLRLGDEALGAIEFLSRSIAEPDRDLLAMMETISGQIGQFIRRKQTEEALRESEERFRGIVSRSIAGVVEVDLTGRFLFANERYCDIVGRSVDELRQTTMQQISHPDDLATNLPLFERIGRDGTPYIIEKRYLRPDGSEVWVNNSVSGLRNQQGGIESVVAVCVDVTDRRRAEDARREGEARLRTLIDSLPHGAVYRAIQWVEDEAVEFTFLSAGIEQLFGISAEEGTIDSRLIHDAIHENDRERLRAEEIAAVANQSQLESEFRIRHRSGEIRWLHLRSAPRRTANGEIVWEGIMLDITDRKRVESSLRENEDRLGLALEAGQMGTWSWDVRTSRVQWSPQLETLHGLDPGTFPGTFEAYQSDMHPDDRGRVLESIERAVKTGVEHHIEYRLVWPDGSIHWVEARGKLFHDEAGHAKQMIGVCMEITERKRREEDLRFLAEASRSLASLVDYESTLQRIAGLAVPHFADWCSIYFPDELGKLRQLAISHIDPDKVQLAEEVRRRWPPDPNAGEGVYQVYQTGESLLVEEVSDGMLRAATKDDEHYQVLYQLGLKSIMCVPLVVRDETIGAIMFVAAESGRHYTKADLALAEDLGRRAAIATENARLYATLRAEGQRKDEFLAMLAHELRNPLAPIRSGLDLLEMMGIDQEILGTMQQQVEHLVRLVDDLLDVSRIMRGKVELRKEPVELTSVINRALDTVRPLAESYQQSITVDLIDHPIWLHADPVRLAQVIGNLLNNASKYTETNGRIGISASLQNGEAEIRVHDTGIGINPDLLPHVFDLFTQDQRTIDRSQGGLGIGLTVVKSLVEMHGGTVSVTSEGPGRGSEFTVRLPTIHRPQDGLLHPPEATQTPAFRILVVDDNVSAAKMLNLLFKKLGDHEVITAHDGLAAIEAAKTHRPDLILLDIGLPKLDGFEVARNLRRDPQLQQVRMVALTGYGSEEDRRKSLAAGFDEHLVKPPGVQMLQQVLARTQAAEG